MRPRTLAEFVGQEHLVGERGALSRGVARGHLASLVLWGPPGTGKTTLARLLADAMGAAFRPISAVLAGVADLRAAVAEAQERLTLDGSRTVLFVDEIHRFNKGQQDALLPHVEDGTITLIGATTENPYYEVNSALLSRARVFRLEPLSEADLTTIVAGALTDERGFGGRLALSDEALAHLVAISGGDARAALSVLEAAAALTDEEAGAKAELAAEPEAGAKAELAAEPEAGAEAELAAEPEACAEAEPAGEPRTVTLSHIEAAAQQRILAYDRAGDGHYDTVSAYIKSLRGNDPDAALYWLAAMVAAGEDPRFICRRLIIAASEDVGNADPRALQVAAAAAQAVDYVGLPEAQYALAQATAYVAAAPKSNRVGTAYWAALADVERLGSQPVPAPLRSATWRERRDFGHGAGYRYPHDFPGADVEQQYLPDALAGRRYYEPSDQGLEAHIGERLAALRAAREAGGGRSG